jgi:hypothetical protein
VKPAINLGLVRPTTTLSKAAKKLQEGPPVRLVVDLPSALHRAVKLRAVERGMTIRDYVLELLAKDGVSE